MPERFCQRRPDQVVQKREHHELTRISDLEDFILAKARQFAANDRMLAEDLAQEAREAIVKRLREAPDCPTSHLKVKATTAVYHFRGRGSSVDGKLYPINRTKTYQITSLEAQIDQDDTGNGPLNVEIMNEVQAIRRFTEEKALTNALFACLRSSLSETENQVLTLRLSEHTWAEVRDILGLGDWETIRLREKMNATVQLVFGLPVARKR